MTYPDVALLYTRGFFSFCQTSNFDDFSRDIFLECKLFVYHLEVNILMGDLDHFHIYELSEFWKSDFNIRRVSYLIEGDSFHSL